MSHPQEHIRAHEQKHAEQHVRRAGYKVGGGVHRDAAQDEKMIAAAVHKHEHHDHPGEPLTKLRGGGAVKGRAAKPRADRFARGGSVKGRGPAKINIVISTGGGEPERQMAFRQGAQVGTKLGAMAPKPPMAAPPMPPRPPMGAPPPGAMPPPGAAPGGPPMMPPGADIPPRPGMMKRGGAVVEKGGAGGGEGRLEKSGMESMVKVRGQMRRRAGGRI